MLAKRIIPCLDVTGGRVVKGVNFVGLRDAGDPVELAARYDAEVSQHRAAEGARATGEHGAEVGDDAAHLGNGAQRRGERTSHASGACARGGSERCCSRCARTRCGRPNS